MNLQELKGKKINELNAIARDLNIEGASSLRKQELIFAILKEHAKTGETVVGDGCLEVMQEGYGFLRSPESSYLASSDDIYVSPSQMRRYNLRAGDTIVGEIRMPREGERYFALTKVDGINGQAPEACKNKILFENLTPLHPNEPLRLERESKTEENLKYAFAGESQANRRYLSFARNFGHQIAITAGWDYARGDAVVIIDADTNVDPGFLRAMDALAPTPLGRARLVESASELGADRIRVNLISGGYLRTLASSAVGGTDTMPEVVAQKAPYGVKVEAGKCYWWCSCGRSKGQPFCDGSHKGTGFTPKEFKADKDETVWFCGCKATGNAPSWNFNKYLVGRDGRPVAHFGSMTSPESRTLVSAIEQALKAR